MKLYGWVLMIFAGGLALCVYIVLVPERQAITPLSFEVSAEPWPDKNEATVARGVNRFSWDMFRTLTEADGDGNHVFSPWSVAQTLGMVRLGSAGAMAQELDAGLHSDLSLDAWRKAASALKSTMLSTPQSQPHEGDHAFVLRMANGVFASETAPLRPVFTEMVRDTFDAQTRNLDFAGHSAEACRHINGWVSDATDGHITNLLSNLDADTRAVLVSAIFMHGTWQVPFDADLTETDEFYCLDGDEVDVPMMHREPTFYSYAELPDAQLIRLGYVQSEVEMVIVLPDDGEFESVRERLSAEILDALCARTGYVMVDLALPRFVIRNEYDLQMPLQHLGMGRLFRDPRQPAGPDFSPMTGSHMEQIVTFIHHANIEVTETGTIASAATGAVFRTLGAPPSPIDMTVDRPFLFAIRDAKTRTILFLGQVTHLPDNP